MSPSTGHQEQATFANIINGSTTHCYWLPTWRFGTAPAFLYNSDRNNLSCYTITVSALVSPQYSNRYAIIDSGATDYFVTSSDQLALSDLTNTDNGPTFIAANGNNMSYHAEVKLKLSP